MRSKLTSILATCVLALALVAAGCGGDDDAASETVTAAEEWADGVCTALTTWTADLETAAEPLGDVSSLSGDSIREASDDVKVATETLTESLRGLGRPDTESGEDVQSSVDDLAAEFDSSADELEAAAADISSIAHIPGAVRTIYASWQSRPPSRRAALRPSRGPPRSP